MGHRANEKDIMIAHLENPVAPLLYIGFIFRLELAIVRIKNLFQR